MIKKNYKVLFYLLLIPFYLNVLIVLFFGLLTGLEIMWKDTIIYSILNFSGAWLLSVRKNIWLNIAGFLCFLYYGWFLISYIFNNPRVGPWQVNLRAGIFIMILGCMGFVFVISKRIKSSKTS